MPFYELVHTYLKEHPHVFNAFENKKKNGMAKAECQTGRNTIKYNTIKDEENLHLDLFFAFSASYASFELCVIRDFFKHAESGSL